MAHLTTIEPVKIYMGKLSHGCDLLEEMTDFCVKENIQLGRLEGLGAVQKARLGFYNQEVREYQFMSVDKPMEITHLVGNVSMKDGKPFVHAHITLADEEGNACGGHLCPGTIIFACEMIVQAFRGPVFARSKDSVTGLPLWEMKA